MTSDAGRQSDRFWWFILTLAVIAVLGLALGRRGPAPAKTVASVNGVAIDAQRVARIQAELHGKSTDTRSALTRAIDEELWLQTAWKQGMVQRHDALRDALIADVQAQVLARHPVAKPTPQQLQALYREHPERFRQLSGMRLRRWVFLPSRGGLRGAWDRATQAYALLHGRAANAAVPTAIAQLADADPAPLPAAVLTLPQLRAALGGDLDVLAAQLADGEVSHPVESNHVVYLFQMQARDVAVVPAFAAIGPEIDEEFQRQAQERVLLDELERLKKTADIRTH